MKRRDRPSDSSYSINAGLELMVIKDSDESDNDGNHLSRDDNHGGIENQGPDQQESANLDAIVIDDDDDFEVIDKDAFYRARNNDNVHSAEKKVKKRQTSAKVDQLSLSVLTAEMEENQAAIKVLLGRASSIEILEQDTERRRRRPRVDTPLGVKEGKARTDKTSRSKVTLPPDETLITSFDDEPIKIEGEPTGLENPASTPPPTTSGSARPAPYPCKARIWPVPDKGLGLIATTNIEQGGLIVSEQPFLDVDSPFCEKQIENKVDNLSRRDRLLFETFTASPTIDATDPVDRLVSIVARNVVPMGGGPTIDLSDEIIPVDEEGEVEQSMRCGFFEYICRANHSCVPNSRWTWNVTTKRLGKWSVNSFQVRFS